MTTQQRKALQQVVLEAAASLHCNHERRGFFPFSCIALEDAYRRLLSGTRWEREEFSFAYWHRLMEGNLGNESLGDRLCIDDLGSEALELRLMMLALLHTLIGTGDFETITGYSP